LHWLFVCLYSLYPIRHPWTWCVEINSAGRCVARPVARSAWAPPCCPLLRTRGFRGTVQHPHCTHWALDSRTFRFAPPFRRPHCTSSKQQWVLVLPFLGAMELLVPLFFFNVVRGTGTVHCDAFDAAWTRAGPMLSQLHRRARNDRGWCAWNRFSECLFYR